VTEAYKQVKKIVCQTFYFNISESQKSGEGELANPAVSAFHVYVFSTTHCTVMKKGNWTYTDVRKFFSGFFNKL